MNGFEVTELTYVDPPVTLAERALWRVLPGLGMNFFPRREMSHLTQAIRRLCGTIELLVVVKGDRIPLWFFEEIVSSSDCPVVLWYMDAVANIDFGIRRAKLASFLVYFERTDRVIFKENGISGVPMDLAADTRWYFPQAGVDSDWDLSFLGTFYRERLEILDQLAQSLLSEGISYHVRGQYVPLLRPWRAIVFRKAYPSLARIVEHVQMAGHEEINMLNAQSRISLNIMRDESHDSLNLRVFELCASGSFQLVKFHPALGRCFEVGKEIEVFADPEEAADKVRYFLAHPEEREEIARAGFDRVLREHTMHIRVGQIVSILKREGILSYSHI